MTVQKYDHFVPEAAALLAWQNPGRNPEYHDAMKEAVRRSMPLLGRALDRLVEEMGHDKGIKHVGPAEGLCLATWRDEDGYRHMCVLDPGPRGGKRHTHQCRCWAKSVHAKETEPIVPSPKGGACPVCTLNLEPGEPAYQIPGDHRYAHAHCPVPEGGLAEAMSMDAAVRPGSLAEAYADEKARAQMCERFDPMADPHENVCLACRGGKNWHSESAIAKGASGPLSEAEAQEVAHDRALREQAKLCKQFVEGGGPGTCADCKGPRLWHRKETR